MKEDTIDIKDAHRSDSFFKTKSHIRFSKICKDADLYVLYLTQMSSHFEMS